MWAGDDRLHVSTEKFRAPIYFHGLDTVIGFLELAGVRVPAAMRSPAAPRHR